MKYFFSIVITAALMLASTAHARNDVLQFELAKVIKSPDGRDKISDDIKLYFGDSKHPTVKSELGLLKTNRKTNAFNKSDEEACSWVLLSAIIALQEEARESGADAVVNIKSNYQNKVFSSKSEFECGAGTIIAGVALKGNAVRLTGKSGSSVKPKSKKARCQEKGGVWTDDGTCELQLD